MKSHKLRSDTLMNVASSGIVIAIMLVSVPLYIEATGRARFGVISILSLFVGYFGLFDLGLGRALTNRMARDEGQCTATLIWSAVVLNALFSAIAFCAIALFIGPRLLDWLNLPVELRGECTSLPIWLSFGAAAASFSSVFNGVLEARGQFDRANVLQITGVLGTQLLPALYAWLIAPTLSHIIPVSVCARLFLVGISAMFALSEDRLFKITMLKPVVMGDLFRYGSTLSVTTIIGGFVSNVDQFIIARQLGVETVPFYTVPLGLVTRLNIIPLAFVRAAFPVLSRQAVGDQDVERDGLRFLMPVMTGLCCSGMFLMEPALSLWLGRSMSNGAAPIGIVMLVGIWNFGIAYVPMSAFEARNRPSVVAKLNLVLAVPYVFGQILMVANFGVIAASLLWSVRYAIQLGVLIVFSRYTGRELHIMLRSFLTVLAACVLASTALPLATRLLLACTSLASGAAWLVLELHLTRPPSRMT